jgi:hypothetical protein
MARCSPGREVAAGKTSAIGHLLRVHRWACLAGVGEDKSDVMMTNRSMGQLQSARSAMPCCSVLQKGKRYIDEGYEN